MINDKFINIIHSKIIYKHGFIKKKHISNDFLTFLKITNNRIPSIWKKIPIFLLRKIWSFL